MKRLQPLALTVASRDECRLRCRPKFDQISAAEYDDMMVSIKAMAIDKDADDSSIEAEFVFTFNQDGAVLQDNDFFHLTNDDYGELWINRSVGSFARANEAGLELAEQPNCKLIPHTLLINPRSGLMNREYKVLFISSVDGTQKEQVFLVSGKGAARQISWNQVSFDAEWSDKNWAFTTSPPASVEPLLLSILRMDEAINLELMPYAMS